MKECAACFFIHEGKWSLWVVDCWLDKRSKLKMTLSALGNCDESFYTIIINPEDNQQINR